MVRITSVDRLVRRLIVAAVAVGAVSIAVAQQASAPVAQPAQVIVGPQGLIDRAAETGAQIYVDDSFPAIDALKVATRSESQQQSEQAIKQYQDIVDQYGQKLIAMEGDSYESITDYVRQRLLAMPSVKKGQYDTIFGHTADKLIDSLIAQHDAPGLLRASNRYFPATAAIRGFNTSAQWFFERGEFASASHLWQQLLVHPRIDEKTQAELLHHIALAEKLAGRDVIAKKFRDRLATEFPGAAGTINGQSGPLLDNLDSLFAQAAQTAWAQSALPADEWPMFQGSPSHSLVTDVASSAGAKLWWVDHAGADASGDAEAGGNAQRQGPGRIIVNGRIMFRGGQPFYGGNGEVDQGDALSSFPVISNGVIFLHTGESVLALSASAGTSLWQYPAKITHPDANNVNPTYNNPGFRATNHDACVVVGDQVFAVLPGGTQRGDVSGRYYGPVMINNRIVALSRTPQGEGKQVLWEKSGSEIAHDLEKDFPKLAQGALALCGSPVVTGQGVYVLARKYGGDPFTQLYLIRLDSQSGVTQWGCYLCSASNNNYYGYGMGMGSIALMSVADDTVYVTTGQGADCAVDADAGRIVWLDITESAKGAHLQENYITRMQEMRSWRLNPPLISGDKVITSEIGSNVRIYNRFNGKLLRSIEPKQIGDANIACGVIDNTLYTIGNKICATDIDTGKDVWKPAELDSSYGRVMGRSFLAVRALYVPFEKGLLTFDIAKGVDTNFASWPVGDNNLPGRPGNLLVTSEQIVVANDTEIAGYSKWETALANRQRAISQHPADPRQYLSLAEIAFRTGHFDLAQEQMKRTVSVAVDPQTKGDAEFLARLYQTNLNFGEQLLAKSDDALRDRSRFYYECCKATAYDSDTQAQWRLCMAVLAIGQGKTDEAAALYNDVLNDAGMRNAPFHRADTQTRAGITAEMGMRALLKTAGRDQLYKIYEDRAAGALASARSAAGSAKATSLQTLIDGYPNSMAALTAAVDLSKMDAQQNDLPDQIKTLRWLYERAIVPETNARLMAARAAADLALAHAAMKRYNAAISWADRGQRQFSDVILTQNDHPLTFHELRDQLRQSVPTSPENRHPTLPEATMQGDNKVIPLQNGPEAKADQPIADGALLTPLESAALYRRPDCFFVASAPGKVSMIEAATLEKTPAGERPVPKWSVDLNQMLDPVRPGPQQFVLLGCAGSTAVFVCNDGAVAVDLDTGKLKWPANFEMTEEEFARYTEQANRMRNNQQQQAQQFLPNGGMVVFNGDDPSAYYGNNPLQNLDAEQIRTVQFNTALGRTKFTSLRLLGTRMLAVVGNRLVAYDVATGKKAWRNPVVLPEGLPTAVVGNDEVIVAQVDNPDHAAPTFVAVDADTGKWHGALKLEDERATWRGLSEDGTLYIVSDQAVSAYDMHGDLTSPLWRNKELRQLRYPWTSQLAIDGLLVINNNNELVCLPQEGGEKPLWHVAPEYLPRNGGQWMALRTDLDGDNIILTATTGCVAYNTSTGDLAWAGAFLAEQTPPLIARNFADPYLVLLGSGQVGATQRKECLLAIDRRGGKMCLEKPLFRTSADRDGLQADLEGPVIHAWQIVDNAILLECPNLSGTHGVYAYRTVPKPN